MFPLLSSCSRNQQNAVTIPPFSCCSLPQPQKALTVNIPKIAPPEPPTSGSSSLGKGPRRVRKRTRPSKLSWSLSLIPLRSLAQLDFSHQTRLSTSWSVQPPFLLQQTPRTVGTFLLQPKGRAQKCQACQVAAPCGCYTWLLGGQSTSMRRVCGVSPAARRSESSPGCLESHGR